MPLLPSPDDQSWLVAALADLVRRRGTSPLLTHPLVLAEPAFFPDLWTPDAQGVERLLRRLLAHAGIPNARVHAEVQRGSETGLAAWPGAPTRREDVEAAGWFLGFDGRAYHFGVDANISGHPEVLVAVLAHETAHAWRATWGLEIADRHGEELLTDLTTVYLGFGVLTTNAAWQFRSSNAGWERQQTGYLDFRSLAFLLALVAHARGMGWWERTRLGFRLSANQRLAFRQSYAHIAHSRAEILGELGVPLP